MSIKKVQFHTKGFLIVEMVLATALFGLLITALSWGYLYGGMSITKSGDTTQALLIAEASQNAVGSIRDEDFNDLIDGVYGLTFMSGKWSFASSSDTVGKFMRSINITSIDKDRKNVTTQVSWIDRYGVNKNINLSRQFSNWTDLRYWYWPGLISALALPYGGDKVQVVGNYAYVTGYSAPRLYIINITSSTTPTIAGTIDLTGNLQNLYVSGNYVYVASDDKNKELQVVNITNKSSPSLAGTYNAPGTASAMGIYVYNDKAFLTRQNGAQDEFVILNVASPSSPTLLGSLDLGATAFEAYASGTLAYVAGDNNTQELQIIDISTPTAPVLLSWLNLSLKEQNRSSAITLFNKTLYLGQGKDLYIIDVSATTSPVQKSDTSVADYFNDVAIDLGKKGRYLFVATSDVSKEFKLYEVSSSTLPYVYGTSLNLTNDNPLYGISFSTSSNMVYAVSHSSTDSFFTIAP